MKDRIIPLPTVEVFSDSGTAWQMVKFLQYVGSQLAVYHNHKTAKPNPSPLSPRDRFMYSIYDRDSCNWFQGFIRDRPHRNRVDPNPQDLGSDEETKSIAGSLHIRVSIRVGFTIPISWNPC